MDEFASLGLTNQPTKSRPLLGFTVLLVEDSRYTSDALRLICLKSGARIRRADSLKSARRHLRVYRPTIVVVDVGLPDGSGLDLIRDLSLVSPRVPVLLAISGDDTLASVSRHAGADQFLTKPLNYIAEFQNAILSHLPADMNPIGLREVTSEEVDPDPIAYYDDLSHVAELLDTAGTGKADQDPTPPPDMNYVLQFLSGVSRSAGDQPLFAATEKLRSHPPAPDVLAHRCAQLADMVHARLDQRQVV